MYTTRCSVYMYRSNTCIETRHVYTIGIAASSTSWRVLGVTGFLLHWGRWCIISCVILHQLTAASVFPSATDEDYQTDNVDSKEDNKEDVNDPGGSLHTEKTGRGGGGGGGGRRGGKHIQQKDISGYLNDETSMDTYLCLFCTAIPTYYAVVCPTLPCHRKSRLIT